MKYFFWIITFSCSFTALFSQVSPADMDPVAKYFLDRLNATQQKNPTMTSKQLKEELSKMPLDTAFLKQYSTNMSYLIVDPQFGNLHTKQGVTDTVIWNLGCDGLPYGELKAVWKNGLPRTGILTDCYGKQHKVNYFQMEVNAPNGYVSSPPKITDSKFEYANRYVHKFKIINAFTGTIDTTILTEPSTDFAVRDMGEMLKNTGIAPPPEARELISYSSSAYKFYSFATLPAGLYIIALFDEKDEIINIKTYRKM